MRTCNRANLDGKHLRSLEVIRQASGFTLIELMVVIAVVAVLTAAAVPAFRSYMTVHGPQYATDELYGDIQLCRLRAARNNQRCRIDFDQATGVQYTITDVNDTTGLPIGTFKIGDLTKYRGKITFSVSPNPLDPDPFTSIEFLPQGTLDTGLTAPAGASSVYLTNQGNTVYYRILVSAAGGTSVDRWAKSNSKWR